MSVVSQYTMPALDIESQLVNLWKWEKLENGKNGWVGIYSLATLLVAVSGLTLDIAWWEGLPKRAILHIFRKCS